jgi:hypothetical protein
MRQGRRKAALILGNSRPALTQQLRLLLPRLNLDVNIHQ